MMRRNDHNLTTSHVCTACETPPENIRRRAATIRKIASVFEDAPPVRVHSDGSQTYGPYVDNT